MKLQEVLKLKDGARVETMINDHYVVFEVIHHSDGEVALEDCMGKDITTMCSSDTLANLDFDIEKSNVYTIRELIDEHYDCSEDIFLKEEGNKDSNWIYIGDVIADIFKNEEFPLEALKENKYVWRNR